MKINTHSFLQEMIELVDMEEMTESIKQKENERNKEISIRTINMEELREIAE